MASSACRILLAVLLCCSPFPVCVVGSFNWDNPPGPQFTEAEIAEQVGRGQTVEEEVIRSYLSNASTHIIAPGDYRWLVPDNVSIPQVAFENLQRPAGHPFTIEATGVTFWIGLREPTGRLQSVLGMRFENCSHVHVRGLTMDSHPRAVIDGRLVEIDVSRNRLLLELTNGSHPFRPYIADPDAHNFLRFLPYKSDGSFMTPLYAFQKNRGIYLSNLSSLDSDGRFWAYFRKRLLLSNTAKPEWRAAYGKQGILEIDDGISILVSRSMIVQLLNCDSMEFDGLVNYAAKGVLHLTGGEGRHVFRNVVFSRRPNTNQLYGGDGVMVDAVRHGPVFDNFTVVTSSDDIINFHSYWGYIITARGDTVEFKKSSFNTRTIAVIRPGDQTIFYRNDTFEKLGIATVLEVVSPEVVRYNCSTEVFATESIAYFPQLACENWTIVNSHFRDCYQRVLVVSGSGRFVNNTLERVGSAMLVRSTPLSFNEGGIPHDILIANNTFIDVSTGPFSDYTLSSPIHVGLRSETKLPIFAGIRILNNTIIRPGDAGINIWTASNAQVLGNTIIDPHYYTYKADQASDGHPQGIFVAWSAGVVVDNNTVVDSHHVCTPDKTTKSSVLGLGSNNTNVIFNGRPVVPP